MRFDRLEAPRHLTASGMAASVARAHIDIDGDEATVAW